MPSVIRPGRPDDVCESLRFIEVLVLTFPRRQTASGPPSGVFRFQDGQRFPRDERGYPAFEAAEIVVVHHIEHVFILSEMLVGPVQRGVSRDDADMGNPRSCRR